MDKNKEPMVALISLSVKLKDALCSRSIDEGTASYLELKSWQNSIVGTMMFFVVEQAEKASVVVV